MANGRASRRRAHIAQARDLAHRDDGTWGRQLARRPTPVTEARSLRTSGGRIWLKLEGQQPGGSIKARVAAWRLDAAHHTGQLDPGRPVITTTSGNFGVGLAHAGAHRGHPGLVVALAGTPAPLLERMRATFEESLRSGKRANAGCASCLASSFRSWF